MFCVIAFAVSGLSGEEACSNLGASQPVQCLEGAPAIGEAATLGVETRLPAARAGTMIAPKLWHGRLTADEPTRIRKDQPRRSGSSGGPANRARRSSEDDQ